MNSSAIGDVSDTGTWVAHCRAMENERGDALFRDPIAKKLVGERGAVFNAELKSLTEYVQFSVVIRTVIIDRFIRHLSEEGIDAVVNLGAGLDTRPYRLEIPSHIKWFEIDYPHVVDFKNKNLEGEAPNVELERIGLDLSDRNERKKIFARIGASSKKVLILAEGVVGYLSSQQVGELADDLFAEPSFRYWISEYQSPYAYRFMKSAAHRKSMENAPFQFMPDDWFGFFRGHRWEKRDVVYLVEEAKRLNRSMPKPWWAKLLLPLAPHQIREKVRTMTGYAIYESLKACTTRHV